MVSTLRAAILFGSCLFTLHGPPCSALRQEEKAEFPSRDELKIAVIHDDQAACSDYPKTFRCPDAKHWVLSVNDVKCADRTRVEAFIKSEAARLRTSDLKHPGLTELKVKIIAESGAPHSEPASLMLKCAKSGIHKLELGEKKTGGHRDAIKSPLGLGMRTIGNTPELVLLIGNRETPEKVRWVDGAGLKEAVDEDAKNLGPRDELPVVIDPTPSTEWTEVIRVMDAFKSMGFERLEFAAPFKVSDLPKK